MKIYGGTPDFNLHLCGTCRLAQVVTIGGHEVHRCYANSQRPIRLTARVSSCSLYSDRRHPQVHEFEMIAWELMTNKGGRAIGFRSPLERPYGQSAPPAAPAGF